VCSLWTHRMDGSWDSR